jgi:GNAT superfamily N-acetyltransferase
LVDVEATRAFLADPACLSFLALDDGRVVGSLYGYVLRRPESLRPKFFLYELDVLESHWRRGIGRQLVTEFLKEARAQNAQGAWVQAKSLDRRAQMFYEACAGKEEDDTDVLFSF